MRDCAYFAHLFVNQDLCRKLSGTVLGDTERCQRMHLLRASALTGQFQPEPDADCERKKRGQSRLSNFG